MRLLEETRAAVESADDARASFTLRVAESALEYTDDRFGPSLELITSAYRDGIFAGDDQRLRLAHMWHGELLSVADRHDEALAIAADGLAAAQRDRQGWAYQMFETWHGRMLLRSGRLSEARAVLEGRFALEDGTHAAAVLDAAGIVALGRLAIHTGDTRQARRLARHRAGHARAGHARGAAPRSAGCSRSSRWPKATPKQHEVAARTDRAGRASDPAAVPARHRRRGALARIALATEDDELARARALQQPAASRAEPGIASIAATAAHVRGLLERNRADLREAVDLFERAPRRLELAAALEDLGAELAATDREAAIDVLGRTLALQTELGATWDARRVRSRLRELGVRRRLVTAEPETSGWAAMTASELAVARLVAEGLTNREVAERLFVSPHTVNSHLRHVFSKLGINSRVELARLARDYEMA